MWFSLLLFFISMVLVLHKDYARKKTRSWKLISRFPGDYPLPIIGNALHLGLNTDELSNKLMRIWRKHGKQSFRVTMGQEDWIFICNPEDIQATLNNSTEITKPVARNNSMLLFFGNSITTSEGERWRSVRKLVSSCFIGRNEEHQIEMLNKYCNRFLNLLDTNRYQVDIYHYLKALLFDSVCSSVMGVDYNMIENLQHPLLATGTRVVEMLTSGFFAYWRKIHAIFVLTPAYKKMVAAIFDIRHTTDTIISKRRDIITAETCDQEKKSKRNYYLTDKFFNSALKNGDAVPEVVINEEISTILFLGHYTTSIAMGHILYMLATHPLVQNQVVEEQMTIFDNDKRKEPTLADLSRMKYLEKVIKETLRVIPPITTSARQLQNDLRLKDGKIIPAGTNTFVLYRTLVHNEDIFPDPFKFDPERFSKPIPAYTFIPFSVGPRNCIGARYAMMVMKTVLSRILRKFEVLDGQPYEKPQFVHRLVTEAKGGIKLNLRSRSI